jgi:hypothetical protein
LIERPPDDGPIRTKTYVGVVSTKINSDIKCALVGFLKNRVKMHGDDDIKFAVMLFCTVYSLITFTWSEVSRCLNFVYDGLIANWKFDFKW